MVRLLAGLLLVNTAGLAADESTVRTSVFAKTDQEYKRQKGPDGRWVREYYALSNGGPAEGTIQDNAQEKLKFASLASVLAKHLAHQGYFPATDSDKVDLLIVVNWGRTTPFNDSTYRSGSDSVLSAMNNLSGLSRAASFQPAAPAASEAGAAPRSEISLTGSVDDMQRQAAQSQLDGAMLTQDLFNRARDQDNAKNARLLGYIGEINDADGIQRFAGGGNRYDELLTDIEEARYYVIVSAYNFKSTVRENKPKLHWVTRMSMRAPGNSFARHAAAMLAYAASRFGQNTNQLERREQPSYRVDLDDIKILGLVEESSASEAVPPSKPEGK